MCAQFQIKSKIRELERLFGLSVEDVIDWIDLVVPTRFAPVLTNEGLKLMKYSLLPAWSREPKVKFATHNARIETIAEKATWKRPFLKNHCVVPITSFIEPIYEGNLAGNMVAFEAKDILCAAGIYDVWVNKQSGEIIESFAIITSEPCDFVRETGHDRQPVFLDVNSAKEWTHLEGDPAALLTFLNTRAVVPELTTSVHRPLKNKQPKS